MNPVETDIWQGEDMTPDAELRDGGACHVTSTLIETPVHTTDIWVSESQRHLVNKPGFSSTFPVRKSGCIKTSRKDEVITKDEESAHLTCDRRSRSLDYSNCLLFDNKEKVEAKKAFSVPKVDFQKAFNTVSIKTDDQKNCVKLTTPNIDLGLAQTRQGYLLNNEYVYDVPEVNEEKPFVTISLKADRKKLSLEVQEMWSGDDIFKVIASKVNVPLEKLKSYPQREDDVRG